MQRIQRVAVKALTLFCLGFQSYLALSGMAHARLSQAALDAVGMAAYIECLNRKGISADKVRHQSGKLQKEYGIKDKSVDVARMSGVHFAVLPYLRADCRVDPSRREDAHQAINVAASKSAMANEVLSIERGKPAWLADEPWHWGVGWKSTKGNDDVELLLSKLISGLLAIGVTVQYSEECRPSLLGFYSSLNTMIVICLNNHNSEPEILSTLAHETVHAIQDCIEGRMGDGRISSISSAVLQNGGLIERKVAKEFEATRSAYLKATGIDRHIYNNYMPFNHDLESEAWALESVPSAVPAFIDACKVFQDKR
jgi:hypothetical protein